MYHVDGFLCNLFSADDNLGRVTILLLSVRGQAGM
jgi:hypothetical protein